MKRRIKLSESDLHRVIKESVNKVLKEDFDMDEFSKQKQDYDVMMNTYECNLSFLEVQSIKSYMTRIKTLVNKIRKGENSEIVYKYLYNCIDNINNIMENK
jgi:CRISPR/Cas system CSM-associated protein Csm2 small subunit